MMPNLAETKSKERSQDRVLVLKSPEGVKVKTNQGLTDPNLFTGKNHVHIVLDPKTCLWYFKYASGTLPPQLKIKFTSYTQALAFARHYYGQRGLNIVDVID